MKQGTLQSHKGFTLMEVMVAVSIFAIVLTVGIGSLLTINNSYSKAQVSRQAIDSLTYILESMSRSLRTAQQWDPGNFYDGTPMTSFAFTDQDGTPIVYDRTQDKIYMIVNGSEFLNLNPANVVIDTLTFTAFGGGGQPSYVQINIAGTVNGRNPSHFAFQTGVSKRTVDALANP